MKQVQSKSSTGGTITEFFVDGVRVKVTHSAGRAYSGKIAAVEAKNKVDKSII
jgi:hypothetical protein